MDTFHCSFFFFSLSIILTVLSLFAPVTSPTVSPPLSPSFCLGNSVHPAQHQESKLEQPRAGFFPLGCPRPRPEPARPGTVRAEAARAVPTDGTALTGRETHGLTPSPAAPMAGFCPDLFPWDLLPSESRFGWIFFPGGDMFGVCYTANVRLTIVSENSCDTCTDAFAFTGSAHCSGFLLVSPAFSSPFSQVRAMRLAAGFLFPSRRVASTKFVVFMSVNRF